MPHTQVSLDSPNPFEVLIVGGGVAALEAALALRDLGGDRIATTMIAPNSEFVYRPMTVREPFGFADAGLEPWAPGHKGHWIRIHANTVSGRRIVFFE